MLSLKFRKHLGEISGYFIIYIMLGERGGERGNLIAAGLREIALNDFWIENGCQGISFGALDYQSVT